MVHDKATASVRNSKITKRGRSTRPPVSLGSVSTRQSYFEPVSGFEPLTVRLQGRLSAAGGAVVGNHRARLVLTEDRAFDWSILSSLLVHDVYSVIRARRTMVV